MFCSNCGKELVGGANFCPACGARQAASDSSQASESIAASAAEPKNEQTGAGEQPTSVQESIPSQGTDSMNAICIAGAVVTVLSLFFNYYGIVSYAGFALSLIGFLKAKKQGEKGAGLAIVAMAVSGIFSLVMIVRIIEYQREYAQYEAAVNGIAGGILDWLGGL